MHKSVPFISEKVLRYKTAILANLFCPFMLYAASHNPMLFLKKIAGAPDEGQQIAEHYCLVCHATKPQIPLGAPRIGEKSDWALRIKQGFNTLYEHTEAGMPPMPPRGGCFECSDRQLKLAIMALLP